MEILEDPHIPFFSDTTVRKMTRDGLRCTAYLCSIDRYSRSMAI
jgi:hypothetical protein